MSDGRQADRWPKLVLFDIDGTLLITKGASSRCMKRAGKQILGTTFTWAPITVGTLDPQIFDQLAAANGITPTDEQRQQYQNAYLNDLDRELHDHQADITLMPGIESIVEQLHLRAKEKSDVILGVLTGNFRRAAHLKLTLSGLGLDRFPVIICAEDGKTRDELPQIAMLQAKQHLGKPIATSSIFIVGDTPRDIQCADANDCVPICVATGYYSAEQLRAAGGQLVFDSFENPQPLLDAIFYE